VALHQAPKDRVPRHGRLLSLSLDLSTLPHGLRVSARARVIESRPPSCQLPRRFVSSPSHLMVFDIDTPFNAFYFRPRQSWSVPTRRRDSCKPSASRHDLVRPLLDSALNRQRFMHAITSILLRNQEIGNFSFVSSHPLVRLDGEFVLLYGIKVMGLALLCCMRFMQRSSAIAFPAVFLG